MPALRRALLRALAVSLIAGAIAVGAASPGYAVPGCSGTSCNGLWPDKTQDCSTANSQLTTPFNYTMSDTFTFQVRRSYYCQAAWGRFIEDDCGWPNSLHWWLRIESQLKTPYGYYGIGTQTRNMWNLTGTCDGGSAWTKMVPAHANTRVRLCFASTVNNTAPTTWECSTAANHDGDWIYYY
jgi:hypothetical protein